MRLLYIFDLDGTLCDPSHRLSNSGQHKKYREHLCGEDAPKWPVIHVLRALYDYEAEIWIWSARNEEQRKQTETWLAWQGVVYDVLRMRGRYDNRADVLIKREWLIGLRLDDRARLLGIFDDRRRLADMWRAEGVTCFHVAEGDY